MNAFRIDLMTFEWVSISQIVVMETCCITFAAAYFIWSSQLLGIRKNGRWNGVVGILQNQKQLERSVILNEYVIYFNLLNR